MKYTVIFPDSYHTNDSAGISVPEKLSPLIALAQKVTHIYWFAYYNMNCPSVRYRGKYVLEALQEQYGIRNSIVHPGYGMKQILQFLTVYFSILFFRKKNSMIVFQKIYTRGVYAAALKVLLFFRKQHTRYDIDDAEYLRFPTATIHYFMRNCKSITVGSNEIAHYASQFNHNVTLLTSPIIHHREIKHRRNNIFTIGWIGFYNTPHESSKPFAHKKVLEEMIFPAILEINFNIRFTLLGVTEVNDADEIRKYFSLKPNIQIDIPEHINWLDEISVYKRIKEFDAGVAPLLNCEMHRAKSAFRLKQYLSCGVPVLANDVGENAFFIKDGFNGFLCPDAPAFKEGLMKLQRLNEGDYKQFCFNARRSATLFSIENYCSAFLNNTGKYNSR